MNPGTRKLKGLNLPILLTALLVILLSGACRNRVKSDVPGENLIPEKDLESILTDVYIADGLLTLPDISLKFSNRDSVLNYIDIIESHGYTYESMNRTIDYYFIRKPKKLIKIYDRVLAVLSEMESRYSQEAVIADEKSRNIWKGQTTFNFPDTSSSGPAFSFTLYSPNTFTLQFSITIYPDDQTINPCFTAWYCSADSTDTGKCNYLPAISYIKDGLPHTYKVSESVNFTRPMVLKGCLLDFENNPDPSGIHAMISDISFSIGNPAV